MGPTQSPPNQLIIYTLGISLTWGVQKNKLYQQVHLIYQVPFSGGPSKSSLTSINTKPQLIEHICSCLRGGKEVCLK